MNERVAELWSVLKEAEQDIVDLQEEIRNGKDTLGGHPFYDFVFCNVGASPSLWKPFQDLDNQIIASKKGDEVLVVSTNQEPFGPNVCYAHGRLQDYTPNSPSEIMAPQVLKKTNYTLEYGVLDGGDLDYDLDENQIIFPVDGRYVMAVGESLLSNDIDLESIDVEEGRLEKKLGDLPHLSPFSMFDFLGGTGGTGRSKILVGPEVQGYFGQILLGHEVYEKMKENL